MSSYRYSNVRTITVSKLSDLDEVFEVNASALRVKNPEVLKVCFAADYEYTLQSAKQWLSPHSDEFMPALVAAGGLADTFNDEGKSSIVLLSHATATILELDRRTGHSVGIIGCASAHLANIEIRKSDAGTESYLPNATLRWTHD